LAVGLWITAAILLVTSVTVQTLWMAPIATSLGIAGWCVSRLRGEHIMFGVSVAMVWGFPVVLYFLAASSLFESIESLSVSMTSGLSDMVGLSHIREGNSILYGPGLADQFSCVGSLDGVIGFLGLATGFGLLFRRKLLPAFSTIAMTLVVWLSLKSTAWTILCYQSNANNTWYEWSPWLNIGIFVLGGVLILSLDRFFASIFEPIPLEFINADFPLFALFWNWLCGLPKLVIAAPERETDFGPSEE